MDGKDEADDEKIGKIKLERKILLLSSLLSHNNLGSIASIDKNDIPDHDLFTYSFPCQDISVAGFGRGLSEGSETRSGLLWECQKIIETKKPKVLLLENVENLISKKHKADFDKWINWLSDQGYTTEYEILNSKDYGIPQHRSRVFAVSVLGDTHFTFPKGRKLEHKMIDLLDEEVDEKYYATEKIQERVATLINETKQLDIEYDKQFRLFGLFDKDGKRRQAGAVWAKRGLCPTIDTMQGGYRQPCIVDGDRVRKVTPIEAGRLMGFDDWMIERAMKYNSNTQVYKQIGNSIVVDVLEVLFAEINIQVFS